MIEAYGRKGMKSKLWRKTFRDGEAMAAWAEKNDAVVDGFRDVDPADHEESDESWVDGVRRN